MSRKNDKLFLQAYTNANYAQSVVDRRSTISYCPFLERVRSIMY